MNEQSAGPFKDDNSHGKGTKYFADGKTYVGDWVDGTMSGEGVFTWPSGSRYEGQFKDDKINGKGTYQSANGNKYVGDWVNEKMSGEGVFTWPNGDRYEEDVRKCLVIICVTMKCLLNHSRYSK